MVDVFTDILPSIMVKKHITRLENNKDYVPFVINKALSYHPDCIFHANDINMRYWLEKQNQMDFYINIIRSRKRPFVKWAKKETPDNLNLISDYFQISFEKAKIALEILDDDQIEAIKTKTKIGGVTKK